MAVRKTAVALPEDLLAKVDEAARARGQSRSRYITQVLQAAVRARRDAEVTRRLDALFADEPARREQSGTAEQFAEDEASFVEHGW